MNLPAELRNRRYAHATKKDGPVQLQRFRPPAITQVSQQIRAEDLPVFFDVNLPVAEVAAPVPTCGTVCRSYLVLCYYGPAARTGYLEKADTWFKHTGSVRLSPIRRQLFKQAGAVSARMKNIAIVLLDAVSLSQAKEMENVHLDAVVHFDLRTPNRGHPPVFTSLSTRLRTRITDRPYNIFSMQSWPHGRRCKRPEQPF